jgi:hypothetical protein
VICLRVELTVPRHKDPDPEARVGPLNQDANGALRWVAPSGGALVMNPLVAYENGLKRPLRPRPLSWLDAAFGPSPSSGWRPSFGQACHA